MITSIADAVNIYLWAYGKGLVSRDSMVKELCRIAYSLGYEEDDFLPWLQRHIDHYHMLLSMRK